MALVFPQYKPAGPNSLSSNKAIRSRNAFANEVTDYLKLDVYKSHTKTSGGQKFNGGYFNGSGRGRSSEATIDKTIYLYLPNRLSENYSAKYNGVELGVVGGKAVGMAADAIAAGGLPDSIGQDVAAAAEAAKPAIGYKLGAEVLNNAVGLVGDNPQLNRSSLAALTTGRVFNPYEETIFQGTGFRSHNFNFKMVPKNPSDVEVIYQIINTLRRAMLPGKDGQTWLTIPDYFRMNIIRHVSSDEEKLTNPENQDDIGYMQKLMSFPSKMVLTNMGVDYSPDGNFASLQKTDMLNKFRDYGPVSYNISLSFQETSYLTKESYPED